MAFIGCILKRYCDDKHYSSAWQNYGKRRIAGFLKVLSERGSNKKIDLFARFIVEVGGKGTILPQIRVIFHIFFCN